VFERLCDLSKSVIEVAKAERNRLKSPSIGSEHLLMGLTTISEGIPVKALLLTNIKAETLIKEVEKLISTTSDTIVAPIEYDDCAPDENLYADSAVNILHHANLYRKFFGDLEIHSEHILLAILDQKDSLVTRVFEELSANITLLRRQIIRLMAKKACQNQNTPPLRLVLLRGVGELIEDNEHAVELLNSLYTKSSCGAIKLPNHREIVYMIMLGYLSDFLVNQVIFQRYLLQELLDNLMNHIGHLDQELTAGIISNTVQTLRYEVRAAIDHIWSHEYSLFNQMLDEAEHDLIGTVLEDLWWEQGEELVLQQLFDEAMDDHRRKHVLSLQKRRNENNQRLHQLYFRLHETINQCFTKRLKSA
jgi:hypothetical protein